MINPIPSPNDIPYLNPNSMFYAPWCSHSKNFAPAFNFVEQILTEDRSISLAKIDCVVERDLYWTQKIESFPTLVAFLHGEPVHYKGERETQDVVNFIRRLAQRSIIDLEEEGGLQVFKSNYLLPTTPVVVLFVENAKYSSLTIDNFDLACKKMATMKCAFSINSSPLISSETEIKLPSLVVIRSFNYEVESVITSNPAELASSDKMVDFVRSASYPNLVLFVKENDNLMFSENRPGYHTHILIMASVREDELGMLNDIRNLASTYNGQCIFIHIDPTDKSQYVQDILNDIRINPKDMPTAIIIKSAKTKVQFYKLNEGTDVNLDSISYWVKNFFEGNLIPSRIEGMPEA